jgi:transposase
MSKQNGVESKVREIRRKTRKRYSAEEKIRIVLEGLKTYTHVVHSALVPALFFLCSADWF